MVEIEGAGARRVAHLNSTQLFSMQIRLIYALTGLFLLLGPGRLTAQLSPVETALRYLDLATAERLLSSYPEPLGGDYYYSLSRLRLYQGETELAVDLARQAVQAYQAAGDTEGLIQARLRLSQALRFHYLPGQAIAEARNVLAELAPGASAERGVAHREIAAAYQMMGSVMVNAPVELMPRQQVNDSVRRHLQQAGAFTAAADTLGQLIMSNLWVEYHSNRRGELALALPYLRRSDSLAQSYGARFPYPVIRVQELWAGYYQRIYKQPANNRAGIAAAQKALALRQQVFGPEHPGHAIPLYTMAALRFLHIDYHPEERSPAAYDSILQTLLLGTEMSAPGFDPKALNDAPSPDQVQTRSSYAQLTGLRIRAYYMRSSYSLDTADWVSVKKLGLAFRDWVSEQVAQIDNYFQLDSFVAEHQVTTSIAILALHDLFKATPRAIYWEEAIRLTELYRAVELRREILNRAYRQNPSSTQRHDSLRLQDWTVEQLRSDMLEPDQGLLVNYRLEDYVTYSLALTPDSMYFSIWGERGGEVGDMLKTLYQEVDRDPNQLREFAPSDTFYQVAHELYRRTWALLGESVLPYRTLVVPDPSLDSLPMGMLIKAIPEPGEEPEYLGLHHAFSYAYSLETLALQRRHRTQTDGHWLGVAPAFTGLAQQGNICQGVRRSEGTFDSLCYVEPEVEDISQWVGLKQTLLGADAHKTAVLEAMEDYGHLHFATHAEAYPRGGEDAYLATSNLRGADYRLYFDDIARLDLQAEQVVLSGCRTSGGPIIRGEGMLSLGRAFAMAGARSVVSSLWSVDDEATRRLMPFYYQALAEGHPKDVALHRAIRAYREVGHSHPAFWMAFRIHGDVSPVRYATWWSYWPAGLGLVVGLLLLGWFFRRRRR